MKKVPSRVALVAIFAAGVGAGVYIRLHESHRALVQKTAIAGKPSLSLQLKQAADAELTTRMVRLLLHGASARDLGFKELLPWVRPDREAMLDLLLAHGANVSALGPRGESLIYEAVAVKNPAAVAILLRFHASIESQGTDHDPLRLALLMGMTGVAIALTKAGADPDMMSKEGNAVDLAQLMLDVGYLQFLTHVQPRPDAETTQAVRAGLLLVGYRKASSATGPWNSSLTRDTERLQQRIGLPPDGHPSLALLAAIEHGLQRRYVKVQRRHDVAELRRVQSALQRVQNTLANTTVTADRKTLVR